MKNIIDRIKIKRTSFLLFLLFLFLYLPFIFYGNFARDDWFLIDLYQQKHFFLAFQEAFIPFSNRPFAAIFFLITSRISDSFYFYLILDLAIYFAAILIIFRSLEEFLENNFIKITFLISLMIPIYSMTNFFSPGMQILGHVSLFLWSLMLVSQKYYFDTNQSKYLFLFFLITAVMLLTYESAFPLISLNIFYPLLRKKNKKLLSTCLIILFAVLVSFIAQKIILPNFSGSGDISRFRLSDESAFFIIRLILINIALHVNIFFIYFSNILLALEDLFSNHYMTIFSTIILFVLISIIMIFSKKKITFFKTYNKIYKPNIIFIILLFILCIFLIALMHTVAKSGVSFWGYNNRALLALSVVMSIIVSFIYGFYKKKKIISGLIVFFLIIKVIYLYSFQLNHIMYSKKILEITTKVTTFLKGDKNISELSNEKDGLVIVYSKNFLNLKLYEKITYVNDNFDFRYLIENMNDKYFYSNSKIVIPKQKIYLEETTSRSRTSPWDSGFHYLKGYHLNNFKYCQKIMWNSYFKNYILRDINQDRDIFFVVDDYDKQFTENDLIKVNNYENLILKIDENSLCEKWNKYDDSDMSQYSEMAKKFSGKTVERKLFYYDSFFLRFLTKIYFLISGVMHENPKT